MSNKAFVFEHEWGDVYIAFANSEEEAWVLVDNYIPSFPKSQRHRWRLVKQFDCEGIHKVYRQRDEFYGA